MIARRKGAPESVMEAEEDMPELEDVPLEPEGDVDLSSPLAPAASGALPAAEGVAPSRGAGLFVFGAQAPAEGDVQAEAAAAEAGASVC